MFLGMANYYPFGMEMEMQTTQVGTPNDYTYNGKEMNSDFGLNLSDYGARWYDASIGRWHSVDLLADHPNQVDKSPYNYAWDNPTNLTDPDGNCPWCPVLYAFAVGFGIGAGADATVQVATNKVQGKDAFEDYSGTSTIISGFAGGFSGGSGAMYTTGTRTIVKTGVGVTIAAGESASKQVITDDSVIDALGGDFSTIKENAGKIDRTQILSDVVMDQVGGNVKVVDDRKIKAMEIQVDRTTRVANKDPLSAGRAAKQSKAQNKLDKANNSNDYVGGSVGNGLQNVSDATRSALSIDGNEFIPVNIQPMARDNTRINIIQK
jgi:RHS repeat-associated protein